MSVSEYINIVNITILIVSIFIIYVLCYYSKFCEYLEENKTKIIFVTLTIFAIGFTIAAIFLPRDILIYGPYDEPLLIPPFVVVFSVIGSLMYFFASTVSEWMDRCKNSNKDEIANFKKRTFFGKLGVFDFERKLLRVIAAPLMAIGIYLLFDLIFFDLNITTERQVSNVSLMNSTMQDLIKEIEAANKTEKLIEINAGISFLAGAFVKQFLDLTRSLAEKIDVRPKKLN